MGEVMNKSRFWCAVIKGGRDVFTLIPSEPIKHYESTLRSVTQLYSADTDLAYVLNQDAVRVAEDICKVLVEAKVLPSNHSRQWSYKVDRRPLDRNPLQLAHVNAS